MTKRNNPKYPLWHCFTAIEVKCDKCGEHYEPICELKHICKKQNSYPIKEETIMQNELKPCPMKNENGDCLPSDKFCTAVNKPFCEALHNAYRMGANNSDKPEPPPTAEPKWKSAFMNTFLGRE